MNAILPAVVVTQQVKWVFFFFINSKCVSLYSDSFVCLLSRKFTFMTITFIHG